MRDTVIRVENLSKRYRVGQRESYLALRDVLGNAFKTPLRLFHRPTPNHIWALKDVSFEVNQGEIKRKFDEIIAFAELEKFTNKPVKYHYIYGLKNM